MYIRGVHVALNDVEDGNVARLFAGGGGNHTVFGLEEAAHYFEDGGFADGAAGVDVFAGKGGVGGLQEVGAGGWDQGAEEGGEGVVHVAWVTEGLG